MELPLYQVDAFTNRVFGGNPAAVCPLESWLPDETLQAIALENNLSETAFFVARDDGFDLRWFTPKIEIDLCGHATLASAQVVFEELGYAGERIGFHTRSGLLTVERRGDRLVMDFPARPSERGEVPAELAQALGGRPQEVWRTQRDHLVPFASEAEVRALTPDVTALERYEAIGVIATAPADDPELDFVSRFFAPRAGVPEDPVTGSAHCVLTPYWAERLGKDELRARQVSERSGDVGCTLRGDRVELAGRAALYLRGTIALPSSALSSGSPGERK